MAHTSLNMLAALMAVLAYTSSTTASQIARSSCSWPVINFAVLSTRNQTGQWTTKVEVNNCNGVQECEYGRPYSVHVNQTTETENGTDKVYVTASFQPSSKMAEGLRGYELVPGLGRYMFHAQLVLWEDARLACLAEGSHLAIPSSAEETRALVGMFTKRNNTHTIPHLNNWAHIGLHDIYTEGQYLTVLGEPVSYANWAPGEPNNSGGAPGEDCMCMNRSGQMNDCRCSLLLPFFCERELAD